VHVAGGIGRVLSINVGDLVWYNCAGSKQTGIVLEIRMMENVITHGEQNEMMKVHWNTNGSGPKPAMYDPTGARLFGIEHVESYVHIKNKHGIGFFKVISRA